MKRRVFVRAGRRGEKTWGYVRTEDQVGERTFDSERQGLVSFALRRAEVSWVGYRREALD
jgi:hypothetical protein